MIGTYSLSAPNLPLISRYAYAKIEHKGVQLNKKGYTLLEVTLFLAISSALALIAFVGLGPKLRNVRFSDAMRGLESSVASTVQNSSSGESNNNKACTGSGGQATVDDSNATADSGTSGDCVNGGLWVYFKEDSVNFYNVPLLRERLASCDTKEISTAADVAICFGFKAFDPEQKSPSKTYNLINGLKRTSDENTFVGYVTNPETNKKYFFIEGEENSPQKSICYGLSGRKASLNFTAQSVTPTVDFDGEGC